MWKFHLLDQYFEYIKLSNTHWTSVGVYNIYFRLKFSLSNSFDTYWEINVRVVWGESIALNVLIESAIQICVWYVLYKTCLKLGY